MKRLFAILFAALVLLRIPSVVQPAGADQGLYAYVGQSILRGEVPYRDAWDQKPPAVHAAYALMYGLWSHESVVASADLLLAVVVALLLVLLGRRLTGTRGAGEVAALLFLLFGNPSFGRMGGVWVRAQCETFIATLAVLALLILVRPSSAPRGRQLSAGWTFGAGLLLGLAFLFKYNAAAYLLAAAGTLAVLVRRSVTPHRLSSRAGALSTLLAGFALPIVATVVWFLVIGAFGDLYDATITYNLYYSGETYGSALSLFGYLVTFPVRHATLDSLWLLGGLGCAVLCAAALRDREQLITPLWVAAACLSIAINGSRDLPQYFVQAAPLLALAAGMAAVLAWRALGPALRVALVLVLSVAVVRVSSFEKLAENTSFDVQHLLGRVQRTAYLARFGGRSSDKYSALAVRDLGDYLAAHTSASERVLVFGFSGGAYVRAGRRSASRFFWDRPVLVGFKDGTPGYGVSGLLRDLSNARPAIVVLQEHDWPAERTPDSAVFFLQTAPLGDWLRSQYQFVTRNETYQIWVRSQRPGGQ
jgi:4-amino-4-deoxy-L-arabinose transferase-like glycosyltransferase